MRRNLLPLLLFTFLLASCSTVLESTPDRPSPYAGDAVLFRADQSIVTGYNLLHEFVVWEKTYRTTINNKDVKHAADNVRLHAKDWITSAKRLREAYKLAPTEPNKTALTAVLDIIDAALTESLGYMTQYRKKA